MEKLNGWENTNCYGDFKSLTEEQIVKYKKKFDEKSIEQTENKINAILLKNSLGDCIEN